MSYFFWCFMMLAGLFSGPMDVLMQSSDGNQKVGGVCTYEKMDGTARILSVQSVTREDGDCKDPVKIMFTFTPKNRNTAQRYRYKNVSDENRMFLIGDGRKPSRNWAQRVGLVKGSIHPAIRSELKKGVCTPVSFLFPQIDMRSSEMDCF